ncbi:MAG: CdaR family protein [Nitrospiraceae bacterium]|nr:CdaR family protein [Nitrospiraceae bacterium]
MKIREAILANIWLKGAALLLAVFLWFFVLFKGQSEVSMDVEPQFKNLPADLIVAGTRPDTMNVLLKGNEFVLKRLRPADVKLPLKITWMETGRYFIRVNSQDVLTPPHVSVVSVSPDGIWVYLEKRANAMLPVEPDITGRPAGGFVVDRISVTPDKAEVRGPKDTVDKLDTLKTEPIDISGVNDTLEKDVEIKVPDDVERVIPGEVRVKISTRRKK